MDNSEEGELKEVRKLVQKIRKKNISKCSVMKGLKKKRWKVGSKIKYLLDQDKGYGETKGGFNYSDE